jgi:competence protein ComEA
MSALRALGLALALLLATAERARAEEPVAAPPCACPPLDTSAQKTVDLNTADEPTLLTLPGIGPSRARAIVDYRGAHGGFRSLSQLLQIKGIGRALLRELRPLVTLSAAGGDARADAR